MRRKNNDRHLGPPAEANRDKHINYVALENNELDPANDLADERGAPRKNAGNKQPASMKHPKKNNER